MCPATSTEWAGQPDTLQVALLLPCPCKHVIILTLCLTLLTVMYITPHHELESVIIMIIIVHVVTVVIIVC